MNPTAAILIIGNEVLSGRTADTNINHLTRRLADVGVDVKEARVVRDEKSAIIPAINALRKTYNYVFTTGGIGPTHDDITIPTIAAAFGVAVERNLQVEEKLKSKAGYTSATLRMADFPAGARVIPHGEDFPPGCVMENVFILAGMPRHMAIMLEAALPLLNQGTPQHTRQVDCWARESIIAEGLAAIQNRYPDVDIGSYPFRVENKSGTALVCRAESLAQVESAFREIRKMLQDLGIQTRAA